MSSLQALSREAPFGALRRDSEPERGNVVPSVLRLTFED